LVSLRHFVGAQPEATLSLIDTGGWAPEDSFDLLRARSGSTLRRYVHTIDGHHLAANEVSADAVIQAIGKASQVPDSGDLADPSTFTDCLLTVLAGFSY
jgi:hypothetical protein